MARKVDPPRSGWLANINRRWASLISSRVTGSVSPRISNAWDRSIVAALWWLFCLVPWYLCRQFSSNFLSKNLSSNWIEVASDLASSKSSYFYEGRDIGSLEILKEVLEDLNIETDSFVRYAKSGEGIDQVANDTRYAYSNGITGVPCFIFDKKYSISGAQEPEAFFPLFDLNINNTLPH